MSAALAYFDGYRSGRLLANLFQAQRDSFGAHTYARVDQPWPILPYQLDRARWHHRLDDLQRLSGGSKRSPRGR